jgi:hypothetical protein
MQANEDIFIVLRNKKKKNPPKYIFITSKKIIPKGILSFGRRHKAREKGFPMLKGYKFCPIPILNDHFGKPA